MSKSKIRIAIDCMGGDNAPQAILLGTEMIIKRLGKDNSSCPVHFCLHGDHSIESMIDNYPLLKKCSTIYESESVVTSDDSPFFVLRNRRNSSMSKALMSTKNKVTDCTISAGNTGALMALTKVNLGMLDKIERPAIAKPIHNMRGGKTIILDLGANLECNEDLLLQFAIMGSVLASQSLGIESPKVALLNIGIEEIKGTATMKKAYELLKESNNIIDFRGYIEPDKFMDGDLDVIVTDGLLGNVMLKTAEGVFMRTCNMFKMALKMSLLARIGSWMVAKSVNKTLDRYNPIYDNGAVLIGVDGISVKAHGNSDAEAFSYAIESAMKMCNQDINEKIVQTMNKVYQEVLC